MKLLPVLFSTLALMIAAPAAHANVLTNWAYDGQQRRLSFTADEEFSPQAILIPNPNRLVVDLPGIRLGRPKVTKPISLDHVQAVRLGQFSTQTTRLVVDFAPGYGIDPSKVKVQSNSRRDWSIYIPQPEKRNFLAGKSEVAIAVPQVLPDFMRNGTIGGVLKPGRELDWLEKRLAGIHAQYPVVDPSVFVLDLKTGDYADLRGGKPFPAASVIKLPILIAYLQDLDAGKVNLDETLVMRPELVASGSGYMQDSPDWTKFSSRYTLTKMIETSDNTATNMIIDRLGGIAYVNQRFKSWGLQDTVIRNWLPDLSGTNTVSSHDLTLILTKVANGNLLSSSSRDRAIYILKLTKTKSLLVPGVGPGAQIAHKTGDIGFAIGDAGIIFMPTGRRYIAAVMLRRPYDDPRGRDYVQAVSKTVYSYFLNAP